MRKTGLWMQIMEPRQAASTSSVPAKAFLSALRACPTHCLEIEKAGDVPCGADTIAHNPDFIHSPRHGGAPSRRASPKRNSEEHEPIVANTALASLHNSLG